jgi:hypothetical protein
MMMMFCWTPTGSMDKPEASRSFQRRGSPLFPELKANAVPESAIGAKTEPSGSGAEVRGMTIWA